VSIVFLSGCAVQKRSVDYPQEVPQESPGRESGREMRMETPKALPAMDALPQQVNGGEQAAGSAADAQAAAGLLSSLTLVDDRIIAYEDKLRAWRDFSDQAAALNLREEQRLEIDACLQRIENILAAYNRLHEFLLGAGPGRGAETGLTDAFVAAKREDISFLESECRLMIAGGEEPGAGSARLMEEKKQEMAEAMGRHEYELVVSLYEEVPAENRSGLGPDAARDYGLALLRTGDARKAGTVLQELLARIRTESSVQQEFALMKLVADIYFSLEEYGRASERYADIVNRFESFGDNVEWARQQQQLIASRDARRTEVKAFADLLNSSLTSTPRTAGYKVAILARYFMNSYPDSPLYAAASRMYTEAKDRADAWFTGIVHKAEQLRAERKYEEALAYLEQLPRLNLLPEKQEQLRALTDELISARFEAAEMQRLERERELEETWNRALSHLRDREYDRAIELFTGLLDTAYGDRARLQIEEAEQLAVQENRRQAAELFVRANRASDLNTKIELLLQSRGLLQDILTKYPQSELADKVKRNLGRIEEEITAIDPDLLHAAAGGETPRQDVPGGGTVPGDGQPPLPWNGQDAAPPQIGDDS
jgi:hypothetical protein